MLNNILEKYRQNRYKYHHAAVLLEYYSKCKNRFIHHEIPNTIQLFLRDPNSLKNQYLNNNYRKLHGIPMIRERKLYKVMRNKNEKVKHFKHFKYPTYILNKCDKNKED